MKPVIELRSDMRDWSKYRLGLFCLIAFWVVVGGSLGVGYWFGSPTLISSELNRQEAESVAYDVFGECNKQFIPEGKPEHITRAANRKCQELFNTALNSGWKKREKKK